LDLHLSIEFGGTSSEVSFRAKGSTRSAPWAELDHDDTAGMGFETIRIAKWLPATYRCRVHNFSAEAPIAASGATLTFHWGEQQLEFVCPSTGTGLWWDVFSYVPGEDKLAIFNQITLL
jgi:hypothetical protein